MKLSEKHSEIIFRFCAAPYLRTFEEKSPGKILRRSLKVIDPSTLKRLKDYVKSKHTLSGGFKNRAGNPDLYYTLFGYYLSEALDLTEILPSIGRYTDNEIRQNNLDNIHLHCAAIISSGSGSDKFSKPILRKRIRRSLNDHLNGKSEYSAFISLLACYYTGDYRGLFKIKRQIGALQNAFVQPAPVIAALLVLQQSFNKPVKDLIKSLLSLYQEDGGFKALKTAPVPDLLSTAVALYSLNFSGYDLRLIKPECLDFVDSLFLDGGFGGNILDRDPDIEYTFYGLLALGSLAD